jgi:hypothetical protein
MKLAAIKDPTILPYINKGEANMGWQDPQKKKEKAGKEEPAPKRYKHDQPISSARFLAPARTQSFPSSLIFCMTTEGKEDLLLKTRSFLSFQISQLISMIAVRKPLGEEVVVFAIACQ